MPDGREVTSLSMSEHNHFQALTALTACNTLGEEQWKQLCVICDEIRFREVTGDNTQQPEKLLYQLGDVVVKLLAQRPWHEEPFCRCVSAVLKTIGGLLLWLMQCPANTDVHLLSSVMQHLDGAGSLAKIGLAMKDLAVRMNLQAAGTAAGEKLRSGSSSSSSSSSSVDVLIHAVAGVLDAFFALSVVLCGDWPGGILSSPAAAAALLSPSAQLVMAAVKTYCSSCQQQQQQQADRSPHADRLRFIAVAQELMQLNYLDASVSVAQWQQQTQLMQSPAFNQLALMMLALRSQQLQLAAAKSSSSSSRINPTTQQQQQWHLRLWQELKLPDQLLDKACAEFSTSDPSSTFLYNAHAVVACSRLLHTTAVEARPREYLRVLPEQLSPLQLQLAVQFRLVPLVLISTAAAAAAAAQPTGSSCGSGSSSMWWGVVAECATFAGEVVKSWKVVKMQHERTAANSSSSSEAPALPPRQEMLQLTAQLAQQVMRQSEEECSSISDGSNSSNSKEMSCCSSSSSSSSSNSSCDDKPSESGGLRGTKSVALWSIMQLFPKLAQIPDFHNDHYCGCWEGASGEVAAACEAYIRSMAAAGADVPQTMWCCKSLTVVYSAPAPLITAITDSMRRDPAAAARQQQQLLALLISHVKLARHLAAGKVTAAVAAAAGNGDEAAAAAMIGGAAAVARATAWGHLLEGIKLAVSDAGLMLQALRDGPWGNNPRNSSSSAEGAAVWQLHQAAAQCLVLLARGMEFLAWLLQQQLHWQPPSPAAAAAAASVREASGSRTSEANVTVAEAAAVIAANVLPGTFGEVQNAVNILAGAFRMWVSHECVCRGHTDIASFWSHHQPRQQQQQQQQRRRRRQQGPEAFAAAVAAGLGAEEIDSMTEQCERLQEAISDSGAAVGKLLRRISSGDIGSRGKASCSTGSGSSSRSSDTLTELLLKLQQSSTLQQLPQQLQELAAAVSSKLPVRYCCNNPACMNLSQASELVLVGGKSCICGGCTVARYCSSECQAAHWSQHKRVCKRVKAAVAAWQQQQQQQE